MTVTNYDAAILYDNPLIPYDGAELIIVGTGRFGSDPDHSKWKPVPVLTGMEDEEDERLVNLKKARETWARMREEREREAIADLNRQVAEKELNEKILMEAGIARIKREAEELERSAHPVLQVEAQNRQEQIRQTRLKNITLAQAALERRGQIQTPDAIMDAEIARMKREAVERERAQNTTLQIAERERQAKISERRAFNLSVAKATQTAKRDRQQQIRDQRLSNLEKARKKKRRSK